MQPTGLSAKQTWILLDFAKRMPAKPAPRTVASRPLVTYLSEEDQTLYVAHDACPHRGAALHRGTVRGQCVVCAYHAHAIGPKAHADRFVPTARDTGLVWVDSALGADVRAPADPPSYPEFSDPSYRVIEYSKTVPVNPVLMTENTLDWQHLASVHRFALVEGDPKVTIHSSTGTHGHATYEYSGPNFELTIDNEYHIPFTTSLRFKFRDTRTGKAIPPLLLWFSLTPLDAGRCELNLRIARATVTWLPCLTDWVFKLIDELPLYEDVEIVRTVDPTAWSSNRLTPGDGFVAAYREAMTAHCPSLLREFVS